MKRIALAAILTAALAGPAFAFGCPVAIKAVDDALAKGPQVSTAQLAEATKLRAEGAKQHKSGQHGASVKTLAKAMEILGIM